MEGVEDNEEFLSLKLAIVDNDGQKKRKKRSREAPILLQWDLNESYEGKIFSLLQIREQMLNQENNIKINSNINSIIEEEKEEENKNKNKGLHLIHSLLISATSVDNGDFESAVENLRDLYRNVSLSGDSLQRVASYFADGLIARLLTKKSPFYDTIMKNPSSTPQEEFLAFTEFYKVSPFYQFAHFTGNQIIMEAFEKKLLLLQQQKITTYNNCSCPRLHVIDFDLCFGFQWPSLIQSLSDLATTKATTFCSHNRIRLKITGFGKTLEELQETEARLVSFAKGFQNLVFEFHGLLFLKETSSSTKLGNLLNKIVKTDDEDDQEIVAVNFVFLNNGSSSKKVTLSSETLKCVQMLNPTVVVVIEKEEGSGKKRSPQNYFLTRFMESLYYFAAMFDSLDDCLPLDSKKRLSIEKNHLGKEIKNLMNYEMIMETWPWRNIVNGYGGRRMLMENHGFVGKKMSSKTVIQAKLLLKIRSHNNCCCPFDDEFVGGNNGGFRIFEKDDGKAISLGWQDRFLITASAWECLQE